VSKITEVRQFRLF